MTFKATIAGPNEPRISALAQLIVNAVAHYEYGTLIDYAEFKKIIFENPQGTRGRAAILQAKTRLLREHSKLLVNEKTTGYRIAHPKDHVGEAQRMESHGRRRYRKSLDIVVHAEEAKLTPEERRQNQEHALRLRLKLAIDRNIAKATLQGNGASTALVIPTGRELAKLLQADPPEEPAVESVVKRSTR